MISGELPEERIAQMAAGVANYLRGERQLYFPASESLAIQWKTAVGDFFPEKLMNSVRTVVLKGVRIPPPPFYAEAVKMSVGKFPDFVHLDAVTFQDIIVFHEEIVGRTLFHGLVHATQVSLLGLEKYAELYVRGFAKTRTWLSIPLEAQAYQLDTRYAMEPKRAFSVEREVRGWLDGGQYEAK